MSVLVTVCLFFALSTILTRVVTKHLPRWGFVDIPNARSIHATPTPRGGGVVFVSLVLLWVIFSLWWRPQDRTLWVALLGGGTLVALIGLIDDKMNLSALLRLVVHCIAAAWGVYWAGGLSELNIGLLTVNLGPAGSVIAWLGVIWFTNLFNFMDGMDGLAAGQATSIALMAAFLCYLSGDSTLMLTCLILMGTVGGFLVWNWHPADVFMGDVGSGFLGYVFAILALSSENRDTLPLFTWGILQAVFLVDASATLLRRMFNRDRWYEPHRQHVYQQAVQKGFPPRQVVMFVFGANTLLNLAAWLSTLSPRLLALLPPLLCAILLIIWRILAKWTHPLGKSTNQTQT